MSKAQRKLEPSPGRVFAALGDETRLSLVQRLGRGKPLSIVELTEGTTVSRQAVTKHLRVLEGAGLVSHEKHGRQALYALKPQAVESARGFLDRLSREWDVALLRLKKLVEDDVSRS